MYHMIRTCIWTKENKSTEGCPKLKRSVDMTSSGMNSLNVKSQMGQDQVSGGEINLS